MRNKTAIIGYGETRFASSFVPDPLFLLPTNMSVRPYLVPKRDIVPELEKIVPLSMAKAVQKMSRSLRSWLQLLQSGSVAMGSMKRGQYDKTITETQKAKIARYAAENGIAAILRHLTNDKARLRVEGEHSERAEEDVLR